MHSAEKIAGLSQLHATGRPMMLRTAPLTARPASHHWPTELYWSSHLITKPNHDQCSRTCSPSLCSWCQDFQLKQHTIYIWSRAPGIFTQPTTERWKYLTCLVTQRTGTRHYDYCELSTDITHLLSILQLRCCIIRSVFNHPHLVANSSQFRDDSVMPLLIYPRVLLRCSRNCMGESLHSD